MSSKSKTNHSAKTGMRVTSAAAVAMSLVFSASFGGPASAAEVVAQVVKVDFTQLVVDGTTITDGTVINDGSTITNNADEKTADLLSHGSQTFSSTNGLTFENGTAENTTNYLTGNLGTTTGYSKLEVLISAKFTDEGCSAWSGGSMLFGLGTAGNFTQYNIYRHSNFIGFNTFNSDVYGVPLPDNANFHDYKFVMATGTLPITDSEIWIDGVKQTLSFQTTSVPVGSCVGLTGTEEINSERRLSTDTYTNGDFMLMSHPLGASRWGSTGTLKSVTINTIVTTEDTNSLAKTGSESWMQLAAATVFLIAGTAALSVRRRRNS